MLGSDTGRQAQSGGRSHRACAFQEGPFGKAGPEAPAPDGGPPSHAPFALSGRIWGATSGLHSTWALLHRHPCPAQRCHCPEETLSLSGPGRFGAQYQEPFTGHPEPTSRACVHHSWRLTNTYYVPGPT
ncbi:unnamed protein product [Rangifer tarandus platyrhynchus]|uniref:Uncharacterized protein n=1 Tax=Rangifer tarandus platyrhynchus TaxID=3082113 RepID=A0AC59Y801_RANTA